MADLKLYPDSQEKLHSLTDTVNFSNDNKMTFGFDKCAIINIWKGEVENQQRKYIDIEETSQKKRKKSRDTTKPAWRPQPSEEDLHHKVQEKESQALEKQVICPITALNK
jgi:inosine-uridine nucleoside N-ribohydrolase